MATTLQRGGVEASREVEVLLLPASNLPPGFWAPANSSCFTRSTERLMQGFRRVVGDLGAIAMENLNVICPNGLADPLGMKLLEL